MPGGGSEVGNLLVEHPQIRFINFTGSMEVGKGIYEKAGKTGEGQIWLKRVIAEMGGKDFMFIDEDADMQVHSRWVHGHEHGRNVSLSTLYTLHVCAVTTGFRPAARMCTRC